MRKDDLLGIGMIFLALITIVVDITLICSPIEFTRGGLIIFIIANLFLGGILGLAWESMD